MATNRLRHFNGCSIEELEPSHLQPRDECPAIDGLSCCGVGTCGHMRPPSKGCLDVQRISQDCAIGEDAFRGVNEPVEVAGQRASGLRFADVSVQALFSALLVFRLLARVFSDRDLRDCWAPLLGKSPDAMTAGQMTYHLRRLRLHGLIERIAGTHRYRVTSQGSRTILFCTRTDNRILRPGLAQIVPEEALDDSKLRRGFDAFDQMLDDWIEQRRVPA